MNYSKPVFMSNHEFELDSDHETSAAPVGLWRLVLGIALMIISLLLVILAVMLDLGFGQQASSGRVQPFIIEVPAGDQSLPKDDSALQAKPVPTYSNSA